METTNRPTPQTTESGKETTMYTNLNDRYAAPMNDADAIDIFYRVDSSDILGMTLRPPMAEAYGDRRNHLTPNLLGTHHFLGSFSQTLEIGENLTDHEILHAVFYMMQGEVWSPNGEAHDLITSLPCVFHTSMSVGDVVDIRGRRYVCASTGWKLLTR
jgi:hypothetical protein